MCVKLSEWERAARSGERSLLVLGMVRRRAYDCSEMGDGLRVKMSCSSASMTSICCSTLRYSCSNCNICTASVSAVCESTEESLLLTLASSPLLPLLRALPVLPLSLRLPRRLLLLLLLLPWPGRVVVLWDCVAGLVNSFASNMRRCRCCR